MANTVGLEAIVNARKSNHEVHLTPVFSSNAARLQFGVNAIFKAENLQKTGSFKVRGALNAIRALSSEERKKGVITYSSGNHAQAIAYAADIEGISCAVVMPEDVREIKIRGVQNYNGHVVLAGYNKADRRKKAEELSETKGYTLVPPHNPRIVAGQGTLGLELLEQLEDLHSVLVPVGGGSLISGIALSIKLTNPNINVIGVETEGADAAKRSFECGRNVTIDHIDTIADGLRSNVLADMNYEFIMKYVDDVITVSDCDVVNMMKFLFERMKLVVEPSGAVAPSAILSHYDKFQSSGKVCAIISGGNIGLKEMAEVSQITNKTTMA